MNENEAKPIRELLEKAMIHISVIQTNSWKPDLIEQRTTKLIGSRYIKKRTGILIDAIALLKPRELSPAEAHGIAATMPEPCGTCICMDCGKTIKVTEQSNHLKECPKEKPCEVEIKHKSNCQTNASPGSFTGGVIHCTCGADPVCQSQDPNEKTQNPDPEPIHPYPIEKWYAPDINIFACLDEHPFVDGENCGRCVMAKICKCQSQEPAKPDHISDSDEKVDASEWARKTSNRWKDMSPHTDSTLDYAISALLEACKLLETAEAEIEKYKKAEKKHKTLILKTMPCPWCVQVRLEDSRQYANGLENAQGFLDERINNLEVDLKTANEKIEKYERWIKVDIVKEQAEKIERLKKALKRYGEHESGCMKGDACNCGLEQTKGT